MVYNSEEVKDPSFVILEDDTVKTLVFKKSDGSFVTISLANTTDIEGLKSTFNSIYAGSTTGGSALSNVHAKIVREIEDVVVGILGDSTGNDLIDWPRLQATALANLYPTHSVEYYSVDKITLVWSMELVSVGIGSRTIRVVNGSVAGGQTRLFLSSLSSVLSLNDFVADVVFISTSHNEDSVLPSFEGLFRALLVRVMACQPKAGLILIQQNPTNDGNTDQQKRASVIGEIAASLGIGVANVLDAFLSTGENLDDYMADTVHPNALGELEIWLPVIMNLWEEAKTVSPAFVSGTPRPGENLLIDPQFRGWHRGGSGYSAGLPRGWDNVGAGVTPSKDGPGVVTVTNKALTNNVATITVNIPHNRRVGETVTVSGVGAPFDGTVVITSAPTTSSFSYSSVAADVTSVSSGGTVTWVGYYETGDFAVRLQHPGTAGTSSIKYNLARPNLPYEGVPLNQIAGEWITFGARMRIPQQPVGGPVNGTPNHGQVAIFDGVSLTKSKGGATGNMGIGYDAFVWKIVSARIPLDATEATVYLYVNDNSTDPTGDITVDRCFVMRGIGLNEARCVELEAKLDTIIIAEAATSTVWSVLAQGDTGERVKVRPDGINFGAGVGVTDVRLFRNEAGGLRVGGHWRVDGALVGTHNKSSTSGVVSIDAATGSHWALTLTGNVTSFAITNPRDGQVVTIEFIQDATGSRTLSGVAAAIKLSGGSLVLTTTPSKSDTLTLKYNSTSATWRELTRAMNI